MTQPAPFPARIAATCAFVVVVVLSLMSGCRKEETPRTTSNQADKQLQAENEALKQKLAAIEAVAAASKAPVPAASKPEDPLEKEVLAKARDLFKQHWTQCGGSAVSLRQDSWRNINLDAVMQCRDVRITVTPTAVSVADNANGLEWAGRIEYSASITRAYSRKQKSAAEFLDEWGWSPWVDSKLPFWTYQVTKRNGILAVQPASQILGMSSDDQPKYRAINCDQIPADTATHAPPESGAATLPPVTGDTSLLHVTITMGMGFAGDIAGFKFQFTGAGAAAPDAEARAFIDQLRARYGEFVSCDINQQSGKSSQPRPEQPGMAMPYVVKFSKATVDADVELIFDYQNTGIVKKLGSITITDAANGDLTYPASATPTGATTTSTKPPSVRRSGGLPPVPGEKP